MVLSRGVEMRRGGHGQIAATGSVAVPVRQVHSVSISKDPSTGLSKGFGFVKYMGKESADKAKATLNGTPLKDFPEMKARPAHCFDL